MKNNGTGASEELAASVAEAASKAISRFHIMASPVDRWNGADTLGEEVEPRLSSYGSRERDDCAPSVDTSVDAADTSVRATRLRPTLLLRDAVPLQQIHGAGIPALFRRPGVAPGGPVILLHRIQFRQRHMRLGQPILKPDCLQ